MLTSQLDNARPTWWGSGPAVSLHAYSPRLDRMTFYETGPYGLRATRTVRTAEPELTVAS